MELLHITITCPNSGGVGGASLLLYILHIVSYCTSGGVGGASVLLYNYNTTYCILPYQWWSGRGWSHDIHYYPTSGGVGGASLLLYITILPVVEWEGLVSCYTLLSYQWWSGRG